MNRSGFGRDVTEALAAHRVGEREQITGHRIDLPGRGQALTPAFHVDEWDEKHATGTFRLGRYYLGGNGAAHGGVIPLMFDEVLGRLANTGRSRARTAYRSFSSASPHRTRSGSVLAAVSRAVVERSVRCGEVAVDRVG